MRNDAFSTENIFGFVAFAAAGLGTYAAFDQRWRVAAFAGGASLLSLYFAYNAVKARLQEKKDDEKHDLIWKENDALHQRINSLEDRIDQCVKASALDNKVRDLDSKFDDIDRNFDAVYRHIGEECRDIHSRIDEVGSDCVTACSGKRK